MNRLFGVCLALAAAQIIGAGPTVRAQDYYPRYFDQPGGSEQGYRSRRSNDDDAYFQKRMKYYSRESVARRDAERRGRSSDGDDRPRRQGFRIPFLERLFGSSDSDDDDQSGWGSRRDPGVEIRRQQRPVRRKPPSDVAKAVPGLPPAPGVVQQPAATPQPPTTFVAVFGDTIADELADGLSQGFSDAPELAVRKHVKPNAGLVRSDYFDFVEEAKKAVAGEQITYAVIDVGINDRQPFLDMRKAAPLSDEWMKRYGERVDAMLAPFKEKKIPVYWVGLAPSESAKASADQTVLNALVKERVEAAGGTYVDVWDGFVDEDGDYMADGPQLDGQTGRLRLDDGIHFSKEGARKLAHYAEREIRKVFTPKQPTPDAIIGAVPQAGDAHAPASVPIPLGAPPPPKPVSSPVVVLTAPRKAEDGALAAAQRVPAREASADAERVLLNGESAPAEPGRMDDHRWDGAKALLDTEVQRPAAPAAGAPKP